MDSIQPIVTRKVTRIIALACLGIQTLLTVIFFFTGYKDYFENYPLYDIYDSSNFTSDLVFEVILVSVIIVCIFVFLVMQAIGIYKAIVRKKMLYSQGGIVGVATGILIFSAISDTASVALPIVILLVSLGIMKIQGGEKKKI